MCISVGPAEFKGTVIANFPQNTGNEQERVLSYMNSIWSRGTLSATGAADSPNAMVFPVYGEVTGVLDCTNPAASRRWLREQKSIYYESWEDESATRTRPLEQRVEVAGNYLVSVATDIEDIPRALSRLKGRTTSFPDHAPEISDYTLESMNRFYQEQGLGIPQFVLAAFTLPPHYIDHKNPVTITYTQFDNLADRIIFPALDYHGEGEFQAYVKRNHTLLLSTNTLNEILGSVMVDSTQPAPSEFRDAPRQFPLSVHDWRNPRNGLEARAPNNDYFFDIGTVHTKLQGAQAKIEALPTISKPDSAAYYERHRQVIEIMIAHLGKYGMMGHSNQPATTAQGFAESYYGDALLVADLTQNDIRILNLPQDS